VFNANWVSGGNSTISMTPTPLTTLASMTITNSIFTNNSALYPRFSREQFVPACGFLTGSNKRMLGVTTA
jgi:hypothetical protein